MIGDVLLIAENYSLYGLTWSHLIKGFLVDDVLVALTLNKATKHASKMFLCYVSEIRALQNRRTSYDRGLSVFPGGRFLCSGFCAGLDWLQSKMQITEG